jgi:hypothetical protein
VIPPVLSSINCGTTLLKVLVKVTWENPLVPPQLAAKALRETVPLGTKPNVENNGEMLRLAVIVTNWPPTPPPVQALPQVTVLPQVQLPGVPVGQ